MGMDVYGLSPKGGDDQSPGRYFRANVWGWRPIHILINIINDKENLGIDTSRFGYNEGDGIKDQATCDILADHLEKLIFFHPYLKDDDDRMYIALDSWMDESGELIDADELQNPPERGTIMFTGIVSGGRLIYPSYSVSKRLIVNFIEFLRNCGGFEIL